MNQNEIKKIEKHCRNELGCCSCCYLQRKYKISFHEAVDIISKMKKRTHQIQRNNEGIITAIFF